ncbi:MAG: phytoene desaturase family protein [Halieaceae bacterium]|jgi:1-hydroxycarotenoid 3,4-desaturase|nr:phytoene desaturase family protein [Halieaceae bacterium]
MSEKPVVVIGAGIAGLSACIRLLAAGREVVVFEGAESVGGKMRQVSTAAGPVDSGPTVFTMPSAFESLLDGIGLRLADVVNMKPLTLLARHAWDTEARLDLFASRERSAEAIGELAGPEEARGYLAFCREAGRMYELLESAMLTAPRPNPLSLAWRGRHHGLRALLGLKPFTTLWPALGRHFRDPRLQQLFGRYATYCGSSPWQAPATLMLIAHLEQEGVWQLKGGMQSLADGLADAARRRGARFINGEWAAEIERRNGRVGAVIGDQGTRVACDAVVCNADPEALRQGLLGPAPQAAVVSQASGERSLSAMTWAGTARAEGLPLAFHTVCFSRDYQREFRQLFGEGAIPTEPTVYLCAQDRAEGSPTSADAERIFCLINAPANGDTHHYSEQEIEQCQHQVQKILKDCGLQLSFDPEQTLVRTPTDFAQRFPGSGGAIYGRATHGWQAAFRRPGSKTRLPGLYLAGGGVHPGAGVPMVSLSGRLAAERLLQDQASTQRSWPAATAGGTSTR